MAEGQLELAEGQLELAEGQLELAEGQLESAVGRFRYAKLSFIICTCSLMLFSDCHQIQCYVDLVRSSKKIVESYLVLISKPRVSGVVGVTRGGRGDQGWSG